MGDGKFRWFTGFAEDAETWGGPYATRADAEADGVRDYEGEPFYVFEADKSVCRPVFNVDWAAESIIESITEQNEECWGEDGADDAWTKEAIKDLENTLERAVAEWLARHPAKTWAADIVRVSDRVDPQKVAP